MRRCNVIHSLKDLVAVIIRSIKDLIVVVRTNQTLANAWIQALVAGVNSTFSMASCT